MYGRTTVPESTAGRVELALGRSPAFVTGLPVLEARLRQLE